ncbi:hypothetical protein [Pseudonocardia sp. MH-G8]|uniref:hypothetical protein n=1 Tax=Pseudonocardia sp. MH-G8 TaxID=1854588 RepID=UPI001179B2CE|nr:hypothetical protein [Pseudonocardia sp. MH-G8]
MDVKGISLVLPAVVVSALLSVPSVYLGLLFLGLSPMCYDAGPRPEAAACMGEAITLAVVLLSTLAVPVAIAVWGYRLRRSGGTGNRALLSLLWYAFVVLVSLAVFAGG